MGEVLVLFLELADLKLVLLLPPLHVAVKGEDLAFEFLVLVSVLDFEPSFGAFGRS